MPVNKPRRLGSFAPLSAQAYKDDALMEAGEAAELLFYRALSFSADVLRDGFISDSQLTRVVGHGMRDAPKRAERLVEVGLWGRIQGGYNVRSWLKWNRSRDEIEGLQVKDSGRKAAPTIVPIGTPPPTDDSSERNPNGIRTESEPDSGSEPDGIQTDSIPRVDACAPAPSLEPTPEPEPEPERASARKRPATRLAADWQPTDAHQAYAAEHRLNLDREVFKFRHHADANDRRQASWNGAFSTWLANADEWTGPARTPSQGRRDPNTGRAVDW